MTKIIFFSPDYFRINKVLLNGNKTVLFRSEEIQ